MVNKAVFTRNLVVRSIYVLLLCLFVFSLPGSGLAQSLYFSVESMLVDVFWRTDGRMDVVYRITFNNSPGGAPIDYVDIGFPNNNYSLNDVSAEIDGNPLSDITYSPYIDIGVAIGLGRHTIQPGQSSTLTVTGRDFGRVLFTDDRDAEYASAVFVTQYFDGSFVEGSSLVRVTFHLPPGVQSDQPRWHSAPVGWPSEPSTAIDDTGRVLYIWENPSARVDTGYRFGASFPVSVVPSSAISTPTLTDRTGISEDDLIGAGICVCMSAFFVSTTAVSAVSARKRRLQYYPPKVAIEGHGIKRGLTAIEAAILMEQPVDKIFSMILFAVIKKNAAAVKTREPLEIDVLEPLPDDLRAYEKQFLRAMQVPARQRRKELQDVFIGLVKAVSEAMRGFSRKETIAYYKEIMTKAWAQVEAADTPEVLSQKFDDVMEWTMLDQDYDQRTRRVMTNRPIFVPTWWGRYDPSFGKSFPASGGTSGGTKIAPSQSSSGLPTLPGGDFAASVVTGVQGMAANMVGNISDFTGAVTNKTNPVPVSTSKGGRSGGSGGSSCACACACAGCACACAGGGR